MPDKYIVNMTEKTAPEDTNLLIIEDAADTKKITFTNLFKPIKTLIGNLASLTTSHKSTIVGATNELKDRVDTINLLIASENADTTNKPLTWVYIGSPIDSSCFMITMILAGEGRLKQLAMPHNNHELWTRYSSSGGGSGGWSTWTKI